MSDEPYLKEETTKPENDRSFWIGVEPFKIGRNSYVSEFTHISQNTIIGSFTSIGNLCTIGAQKHPLDRLTTFPFIELLKSLPPTSTIVGNDVWIGCNSVIIQGVSVGDGAVIGAGSVVTRDVAPYSIVIGNPARLLRYRFQPSLIQALLETRWWDLPADVIKSLPFNDPWACVETIRGLDKAKTLV